MLIVNELLDAAKAKLVNLESGEIFLFLNYIKSNDMGIVPIVKISSGQRDIN